MGLDSKTKITERIIVGSLGWKLLERGFTQGVNLLVQIILARILLPYEFGIMAIVVAIANYAAIFVQSGLGAAIVQRDDLEQIDVDTLLTTSVATAMLLYIFLFTMAPIIAELYGVIELSSILRVLSIVLFLNALNAIQTAILQRRMDFRRLFFRSLIAIPVSGCIGIAAAILGFGVWALVFQSLTNMLLVVLTMTIGTNMNLKFRFSLHSAKRMYSFAFKVMLTSLVSGGYDTLRTMMIGKAYTTSDLAFYDKGYVYSNYVTQIVNSTISSVLLPVFSRKQTDYKSLLSMARRSASLSAFAMLPVLAYVAAASEPLVVLMLGEKWAPAVPYLALFCLLRMPGCVMSVDKQIFYAMGRSGINLAYEIGLLALNLAVLAFTIRLGTMAICIGAVCGEYAGFVAICLIASRVYGYKLLDRLSDFGRPFACSLLTFIGAWAVSIIGLPLLATLVFQTIVSITVYVVSSRLICEDCFRYTINIVKGLLDE